MEKGVTVMIVMVMIGSAHGDPHLGGSGSPCQQIRGDCRMKTFETEDGLVSRNVSCYCKYDEDVSHQLGRLTNSNCKDAFGQLVNVSILHIVGCNVTSKAPLQSLLATLLGTSDRMELYVEGSSWLSLASPSASRNPNTISATFLNSNMSGMPAGVVGGANVSAEVVMEGCEVGVLETRAFSGYAPDAQVNVTFRDSKILTVKQGAFDLPRDAQVELRGGHVVKFEDSSYVGGAELTLDGVRVDLMLESALSIHGLKKLSVTNCTMADVYHHALSLRPPSYDRNIRWGGTVVEGSEAIFSDNKFLSGNGQAFARLCNVAKIRWRNNTVLTTMDMPLRLQSPECRTEREWRRVFSLNSQRCENCTHFANPDAQTCALFESIYCACPTENMDGCGKRALPYIISKCQDSHPDITKALLDTCQPPPSREPKALEAVGPQADGSSASSPTLLSLGVALCVSVVLWARV